MGSKCDHYLAFHYLTDYPSAEILGIPDGDRETKSRTKGTLDFSKKEPKCDADAKLS